MAPNQGDEDVQAYVSDDHMWPTTTMLTSTSLSRTPHEFPYSSMIEHARRPSEAYVNLHANVEAKYVRP